MNVLITGKSGLIGSKLYENMNLFNEVDTVDKKIGLNTNNFYTLNAKYDMIIHCASNCVIRDVINNPRLMKENVNGSIEVMELARRTGCKKVVLFSSSRVCSDKHNPYIAGKRFMEELAESYKECYGIDYVIIRPETVWGLNDNKNRVIPRWINAAINNEDIIVYGDKNKELPPVYVDDFMESLMLIINNFDKYKNNTFRIMGEPQKVVDIIKTIKKVFGSKSKVVYKKPEKSQPQKCDVEDVFCAYPKEYFKIRLEMIKIYIVGGKK